jgi:hypothetical protein
MAQVVPPQYDEHAERTYIAKIDEGPNNDDFGKEFIAGFVDRK